MVQVNLTQGILEGKAGDGFASFMGIPFAAPPVGGARFAPPGPAPTWEGVRSAAEPGPASLQGESSVPGMAASGPRSEDCLYLNVWTPASDQGKRPVLVWIHGGGFVLGSGSGPLYRGGPLAVRGDVVVVSIQYRLGALGYADFGPDGTEWGATPNAGQLDQVAALRWVQEHIYQFGGDAGNVTVFGESAGAMAISCLLAMPAAEGLFHKAIMQSGGGMLMRARNRLQKLTGTLVEKLGVTGAAILDLQGEKILEAQASILAGRPMVDGFGPCADGEVLPEMPHLAVQAGRTAKVPVLMGTNRDEMTLFNTTPGRAALNDSALQQRVAFLLFCDLAEAGEVISKIRASRRDHGLPDQNHNIFDTIQTVAGFRIPGNLFAEARAREGQQTWMYLFTHESPAWHGVLGSCHALELPFVFGTLDAPTQDKFAGTGEAVEALSGKMMDAWIAFARNGDPSHDGLDPWQPYDEQTRATMIFHGESHLATDPFAEERLALEDKVRRSLAPG